MYEYELMNKSTKERIFVWGYSWNDAMRRNPSINENDWTCLHSEYVD